MALLRIMLGVVVGVGLGLGIVYFGDKAHTALFPIPADINPTRPDQLRAYLASALVPGLLGLPLVWAIAAFAGAFASAKVAQRILAGRIVGVLLLACAILNVMYIPAPWWMAAAAVVAVALAAWTGARLGAPQAAQA
jgi:hypothetical protein